MMTTTLRPRVANHFFVAHKIKTFRRRCKVCADRSFLLQRADADLQSGAAKAHDVEAEVQGMAHAQVSGLASKKP